MRLYLKEMMLAASARIRLRWNQSWNQKTAPRPSGAPPRAKLSAARQGRLEVRLTPRRDRRGAQGIAERGRAGGSAPRGVPRPDATRAKIRTALTTKRPREDESRFTP